MRANSWSRVSSRSSALYCCLVRSCDERKRSSASTGEVASKVIISLSPSASAATAWMSANSSAT